MCWQNKTNASISPREIKKKICYIHFANYLQWHGDRPYILSGKLSGQT